MWTLNGARVTAGIIIIILTRRMPSHNSEGVREPRQPKGYPRKIIGEIRPGKQERASGRMCTLQIVFISQHASQKYCHCCATRIYIMYRISVLLNLRYRHPFKILQAFNTLESSLFTESSKKTSILYTYIINIIFII